MKKKIRRWMMVPNARGTVRRGSLASPAITTEKCALVSSIRARGSRNSCRKGAGFTGDIFWSAHAEASDIDSDINSVDEGRQTSRWGLAGPDAVVLPVSEAERADESL